MSAQLAKMIVGWMERYVSATTIFSGTQMATVQVQNISDIKAQCPDGQFSFAGERICLRCPSACLTCNTYTACLTCRNGTVATFENTVPQSPYVTETLNVRASINNYSCADNKAVTLKSKSTKVEWALLDIDKVIHSEE
jgi:hypothetical protein